MKTLPSLNLADYLAAVAAKQATPGGGVVAAIAAAEGCALIAMVANFSKGDRAAGIAERCAASLAALLALAEQDSLAFGRVMQAGKKERPAALQAAAEVPAQVIDLCRGHVGDLTYLLEHGNANLVSDLGIAAHLFIAGIQSSALNVLVNVNNGQAGDLPDSIRASLERVDTLVRELAAVAGRVQLGLT